MEKSTETVGRLEEDAAKNVDKAHKAVSKVRDEARLKLRDLDDRLDITHTKTEKNIDREVTSRMTVLIFEFSVLSEMKLKTLNLIELCFSVFHSLQVR